MLRQYWGLCPTNQGIYAARIPRGQPLFQYVNRASDTSPRATSRYAAQAGTVPRKPAILDQVSHMFRQVSLQAANNGPYAQLMVSACRAIGWRLSKGGSLRRYLPRPRQRHLYLDQDVTNGNHFLGAFIYVASRLPILINQKRPYPAWMLYDRLRPATTALNLDSAAKLRYSLVPCTPPAVAQSPVKYFRWV